MNNLNENRIKIYDQFYKISNINKTLAKQNQYIYARSYHPIKGEKIDFKEYPYLIDIYDDTANEIVIQKSAQCGISEYLIDEAFYLTENKKLTGLYCFPAQLQLNAFSHGRIESIIRESEHFSKLIGDIDNVELKNIGGYFIYLRGMKNLSQITSINADYLIIDEVDLAPQKHIPVAEKRLGGSKHKIRRYVSTPTYQNHGVNLRYQKGTMNEWFIKCEHCNTWQYLDFFKNIDFKSGKCICKKCKKEIDRLSAGEWVARHKDREIHSYHISKLFSARSSIKELIRSYEDKESRQTFYNFDLGLPYTVEGQGLNKTHLDAISNKSTYALQYNGYRCCMGVDVGAVELHYYITDNYNGKPRTLLAGTVTKFDELDTLMKMFNVSCCVIDAQPEVHSAKNFAKRFPGRVHLAYYPPSIKRDIYYKKDLRDNVHIVNINRTLSLDYMVNQFVMHEIDLPKDMMTVTDFYNQMTSLTRIEEKDRNGNLVARYIEQGADHFSHARNYCKVAEEISGEYSLGRFFTKPKQRKDRTFHGSSTRTFK